MARALGGLTLGQPKTFFDALPVDLADAIACMTPHSVIQVFLAAQAANSSYLRLQ